MKKFLMVLLLLALAAYALPAAAEETSGGDVNPAPVFTADVGLVDIENAPDAYLLHLRLPEGEIVVDAAEYCSFLDGNSQAVSAEVFLNSYRGKKISISFFEREPNVYMIYECRG